jgi:hypothetical protein
MNSHAQNLDKIGDAKPFEMSGGLSLNQVVYTSFGKEQRRDPYSFVATGNLNLGLYGWSVPLSFSFSNQGHAFQQPFNQYSLHPSYKSIRADLGYTSASYSPYSVNGHNFLGAAIDCEPEGKLKFSALYGRFLKAVRYDSASMNVPAYQRIGYGAKAQYIHENNSVQLTMFHAQDEDRFLGLIPDSLAIHPQENLVLSVAASTVLFSKFLLKGEIASSAVTSNVNSAVETSDRFIGKLSPFYTPRITSTFYNAWKANFDYQQQSFTIGIGYERVEPDYKTFGSYYFNNDLENMTVNASTSAFEGKMSVAGSIGVQHDNLDKTKVSTLKRSVGSANVSYSPSEKVSLSGSYSSFQTFTNIQSQFQQLNQLSPYENIDTLNFTQLSRSGNFNVMYALGANPERKQSINFNSSVQGASDRQGDVVQNSGAWFYNVNVAYSVNIQPRALTFSLSFNGGANDGATDKSVMLGPVLSITRSFFEKKLRTSYSINYTRTSTNGSNSNAIASTRLGGVLKIKKQHNLNLNLSLLGRNLQSGKSLLEMTTMLGYSYNFSAFGNK